MMRSMMSAVTGLRAMQTAMDVIANNIANENTDAFKASTANFADMFYQTLESGDRNINPSQVGYGTKVADVSVNMTNSGRTETDNPYDLYVDGEGYFAIGTQANSTNPSYYTRLGHFHISSDGYLCDSFDNYVMGTVQNPATGNYSANSPICIQSNANYDVYLQSTVNGTTTYTKVDATQYSKLTDIAVGTDGSLTATLGSQKGSLVSVPVGTDMTVTPAPASNELRVALATFVNPNGLSQEGNEYYTPTQSSGTASFIGAGSGTKIEANNLEMSNVDLSKEFTTMITTQRGFQADSRIITVSDTLMQELVDLKRS